MKSGINPFDSQEAKPYKNDPEILAMTNLVAAYQNDDINEFETILKQNRTNIMDDPFIREHIEGQHMSWVWPCYGTCIDLIYREEISFSVRIMIILFQISWEISARRSSLSWSNHTREYTSHSSPMNSILMPLMLKPYLYSASWTSKHTPVVKCSG